jgi:hypothetical protein
MVGISGIAPTTVQADRTWVPDEKTAVAIAEAVLSSFLQKRDLPLTAKREGDHWVVQPNTSWVVSQRVPSAGGGFRLLIDQRTAAIVAFEALP